MSPTEASERAALLHRIGAAYVDALRAGDFDAIPYAEEVELTNFRARLTKGLPAPLVGRSNLRARWWDEMRAHYFENGQRPALTLMGTYVDESLTSVVVEFEYRSITEPPAKHGMLYSERFRVNESGAIVVQMGRLLMPFASM